MSTLTMHAIDAHRWRIGFDSPPVNLVTPELVADLQAALDKVEADPDVKVVVFESANDHFWLNHFDLARVADFPVTTDGGPMWTDIVLRLTELPVVSVAKIRGRARGGGNEFLLACDLRYASEERALLGQIEVGTGILPGGGGTERLPRMIGRDRALEAVLTCNDYPAAVAARYGWVTEALPDAELDEHVDSLTARIATFDKPVLAGAKAQINRATLPPAEDVRAAYGEFVESMGQPWFRHRLDLLRRAHSRHGADLELSLGKHIGRLAED
ncbi:enoyl-CoA hydratase/isomerase family protein [Lentzea sp. NPDC003310]|uniref:enoyl-CoA hydratase/isomerase family protein n=1 Tax=Lentzea sp. NPDC003310 TaxID=3154447 RepID=UPI00339E5B5D